MIYQLSRAVETLLRAKGWAIPVVYHETTKPTAWRNAVVFERLPKETVSAPRGTSDNPKRHYQRAITAKATVYGQAPQSGAKFFEHEHVTDELVDATLIALRKAGRTYGIQITASEQVPIDDLAKSEAPNGLAHDITFTLSRGVTERDRAGAAGPEFEITEGSVVSRTDVGLANQPAEGGVPVTTSCGEP